MDTKVTLDFQDFALAGEYQHLDDKFFIEGTFRRFLDGRVLIETQTLNRNNKEIGLEFFLGIGNEEKNYLNLWNFRGLDKKPIVYSVSKKLVGCVGEGVEYSCPTDSVLKGLCTEVPSFHQLKVFFEKGIRKGSLDELSEIPLEVINAYTCKNQQLINSSNPKSRYCIVFNC